MTIKETLKGIVTYSIIIGGFLGILGGGIRGCSYLWNDKTVENSAYVLNSRAIGVNGHIELTQYSNGSFDVKKYPGFGHTYFSSKLYQDLDGDTLVDGIRVNSSAWRMNSIKELLVREHDYETHKKEFDEADLLLRTEIARYANE